MNEGDNFEVIDISNSTDCSHGFFRTLDEAMGCVQYDRLRFWEIVNREGIRVAWNPDKREGK